MSEKTDIITLLSRVKHIGRQRADELYEDYDVRSLEDLIEMGRANELQNLKFIGATKETKIVASAEELLSEIEAEEEEAEEPSRGEIVEVPEEEIAAEEEEEEAPASEEEEEEEAPASEEEEEEKEKVVHLETAKEPPAPEEEAGEEAEVAASYLDRFVDRLRCPACGNIDFDATKTTLTCTACRREYTFQNGIADMAPPQLTGRSVAQRVMESRFYARFYEDVMRPKLTGLVSERSMREEYVLSADLLELDGDARVLDVACGTGNFTRYFAQRMLEFEDTGQLLVGMDLSWPMLETARSYLRRDGLDDMIYLIRGDATRIPVQRASFNRLHCGGALHIMSNVDEALRNFARVLEPGGICVIGAFILGEGIFRRLLKRVSEVPTNIKWFSRDDLHERLERTGFEVADESISGDAITLKARRT